MEGITWIGSLLPAQKRKLVLFGGIRTFLRGKGIFFLRRSSFPSEGSAINLNSFDSTALPNGSPLWNKFPQSSKDRFDLHLRFSIIWGRRAWRILSFQNIKL